MSAPLPTRLVRSKVIAPFVADVAPWVTPPSDVEVTILRDLVPGVAGDRATRGHILYPLFRDAAGAEVTGPTVTFRTWLQTEEAQAGSVAGQIGWAGVKAAAAATHREGFEIAVQNCGLWVQVTAVAAVGAAVTVEFWVAEEPGL